MTARGTVPPSSRPPASPRTAKSPSATVTAAKLMYAGAVASLLSMAVDLAVIGDVKKVFLAAHPDGFKTAQSVAGAATFVVVVGGIVSIVLWLRLASATRKGRAWPRPVGTVLLGLHTVGMLATFSRPGIPAVKWSAFIIWLIGLAAVVVLWRRPARARVAVRARV